MAFELREGQGALHSNVGKDLPIKDNPPDYSGACVINGVECWLDGWIKTAQSGKKWMSLTIKPKARQSGQYPSHPAPAPQKSKSIADMDSDIPF